ncbi:MAG: hypothetical protein ACAI35_19580 [Candidatus Methylacidiphilales bacterium]
MNTSLSKNAHAISWNKIRHEPDAVTIETDHGFTYTSASRAANGDHYGVQVWLAETHAKSQVVIASPDVAVKSVQLRWNFRVPSRFHILNDAWERGYGTLQWAVMAPERVLPWYFMATDTRDTVGIGVRTQPNALCFWRVDTQGVTLCLDVRNGGEGVFLGDRLLRAAEIVVDEGIEGSTPFEAACRFCRLLCPQPRLPNHIVYGSNNWYYAYGNITPESVREDGKLIADLTQGLANRPYMVIDDGWQQHARPGQPPLGGPWTAGNSRFYDMMGLAKDLKSMGTRPGLWNRPMGANPDDPDNLLLPLARANEASARIKILDPSIPEVLERIENDFRVQNSWGYELLKHDWTTHDIFGRWGFAMQGVLTNSGWHFYDRTRTTAEIILELYRAIRRGAGESVIIGCNTVGHLSAGIFELQRTGDDTSGRNWERTRRMGINTLAFRMPQHNAFFAVDADCVGITGEVPWELNSRWLDLLARSGTPLFVSADPKAVGPAQRRALIAAFRIASSPHPVAEPLDWLDTTSPAHWRFLTGAEATYDWLGTYGVEGISECPP